MDIKAADNKLVPESHFFIFQQKPIKLANKSYVEIKKDMKRMCRNKLITLLQYKTFIKINLYCKKCLKTKTGIYRLFYKTKNAFPNYVVSIGNIEYRFRRSDKLVFNVTYTEIEIPIEKVLTFIDI